MEPRRLQKVNFCRVYIKMGATYIFEKNRILSVSDMLANCGSVKSVNAGAEDMQNKKNIGEKFLNF